MSVYSGTLVLDANGEAEARVDAQFPTAGQQFHFQLTPVGGAAALYVAREMQGNSFHIAGGKPGLKVSWQLTAIRSDAQASEPPERSASN